MLGACSNPDGFGFAIMTEPGEIVSERTMKAEDSVDRFLELRAQYPNGYAVWHCRIATHGTMTVDNCHPFEVGGSKMTYLAHNGVLSLPMEVGDNRSDTRVFAEEVLPALGGVSALDNDAIFTILEKWSVGSKLVVLTVDPSAKSNIYLINEKSGSWDKDGVWWSNTYHRWKAPTQKTPYFYDSGYHDGYKKSSKYGKYDYDTNTWDPTFYLTHVWNRVTFQYDPIDEEMSETCPCPPDVAEFESFNGREWCWVCGLGRVDKGTPLALAPPSGLIQLPFLNDEEYTRLFTDGESMADKTWDCPVCASLIDYEGLMAGYCDTCDTCLDCSSNLDECLCYFGAGSTKEESYDVFATSDYDYEMID